MIRFTLLLLTLSGIQGRPVANPRRLQETSLMFQLPDGYRQGTEHSEANQPAPGDFRQGTGLQKPLGNGFGEMDRRHWLTEEIPDDIPAQKSSDGSWVRVAEPSAPDLPASFRQGTEHIIKIPDGFRQGTEPIMPIQDGSRQGTEHVNKIPDGFRQGTEPMISIQVGVRQENQPMILMPDGFRQGTEHVNKIPDGFRQGTEHVEKIPDGFRQGTEPIMPVQDGFRQGTQHVNEIPNGFRQGTEPVKKILDGFRQGTEPMISMQNGFRQGTEPMISMPDGFRQGIEYVNEIPDGFRQGTEPSTSRIQTEITACLGEVINKNCYEFNPKLMAFQDAQSLCRVRGPNAELASITSGDLHSRLVSLVTSGGKNKPVLTWLGATVKKQQASWVDGSKWSYSDWMPGSPNVHSDRPVCLEMFHRDESWWTVNDCELQRASICSYPITA